MPDEFDAVVLRLAAVRDEAASPKQFSEDAASESNERSDGQLRRTVPVINQALGVTDGLARVEPVLTRAARLVGVVAKALAEFHDDQGTQTDIDVDQARKARTIAEEACKLRLANLTGKPVSQVSVRDGLACG